MFKNMKLGTKISGGFCILIVLACALGGLAVRSMHIIEEKSMLLEQEYVPEVEVANSVESNSAKIMLDMRGYTLSEDRAFLESATEGMKRLDERVGDARKLAEKAKNLSGLQRGIQEIEGRVGDYKKLVSQTEKTITALQNDRIELDSAAAKFMQNCSAFLAGQDEAMKKEVRVGAGEEKLLERLQKITLVNDVIDLGNATRIAAFKSQALNDPKLMEGALTNFDTLAQKYKELRRTTRADINLKQIDNTEDAGNRYKEAMLDLLKNWQALGEIGARRGETGDKVMELAEGLVRAALEGTTHIAQDAVKTLSMAETVMIVGLIAALVLGVMIAYFITRSITRPVNRIIEGLGDGAEQVSSASAQVSSASQSLAEGSSEQAAALEETSSSLEQMASMTKQNAGNANQADKLMKDANLIVSQANESMEHLTASMQEISKASEETSKIIKTIDEIAFQTNLLALNAAVEAARAGEAGAGFAVVADEVRNLAMRAAEAAKNTASLIEGTVKKVKDGGQLVNRTNEAFAEVAKNAERVGELVAEIAAASNEQAQGIEQVNKAVSEMDKVTQQTAANAEESASASEEMNAQAEQMKSMVGDLISLVGRVNGGNGESRENRHAATAPHHSRHRGHGPLVHAPESAKGKHLAQGHGYEVKPENVIPMGDEEFKDF